MNLIQDMQALFSPETLPNPHIAYAAARRHGNLIPIPEMNSVLGLATNRVAGDAGLIFFDFDLAASKLLPTPSGFAAVAPIAVYPATRKLLARGTKTNPAATEF